MQFTRLPISVTRVDCCAKAAGVNAYTSANAANKTLRDNKRLVWWFRRGRRCAGDLISRIGRRRAQQASASTKTKAKAREISNLRFEISDRRNDNGKRKCKCQGKCRSLTPNGDSG